MHCRFSFSQLPDPILPHTLASAVARDRSTIAEILGLITEVDARKLYLPAGYPSMFAYCVGELHLSEDATAKRIHAARVTSRFPAVLEAVAEGRLHLSAVVLLAPHLTESTVAELLAAATHKSKSEVERLLADRFPRSEMLTWVAAMPESSVDEHAPGHVEGRGTPEVDDAQLAPERVGEPHQHAPGHVHHSKVRPLSSQSFEVQFTMGQRAHDKLRYAQDLLSHRVPSGDIAQVIERALDAVIPQLEKAKFAATAGPTRVQPHATASPRHIPAHVMRAVWERDGGQCTFMSESGRRCPARKLIEYDHVQEVARGGEATVDGIRLRCRAHNQYGAECTLGAEFMRHKRLAAADARAVTKQRSATARATPAERTPSAEPAHVLDVVPWLRQLGFKDGEARSAAALCESMPEASLEERVRVALSQFRVRGTRVVPAPAT